ncbi:MAG: hypothetical protein JXR52_08575 [Bacteroidales bacterium]|nr:hypothetical protein [Bacteroidales bacterium]
MKKIFISFLIALPFSVNAQTATIKIDTDRVIGEIHPNIHGVFMEPIHFSRREPGSMEMISFNTL